MGMHAEFVGRCQFKPVLQLPAIGQGDHDRRAQLFQTHSRPPIMRGACIPVQGTVVRRNAVNRRRRRGGGLQAFILSTTPKRRMRLLLPRPQCARVDALRLLDGTLIVKIEQDGRGGAGPVANDRSAAGRRRPPVLPRARGRSGGAHCTPD